MRLRYFMKKIIEKIKSWWSGEEVFHSHPLVFSAKGQIKRHWTSIWAHSITDYIKKHQSWIIPTLITVVLSVVLAKI